MDRRTFSKIAIPLVAGLIADPLGPHMPLGRAPAMGQADKPYERLPLLRVVKDIDQLAIHVMVPGEPGIRFFCTRWGSDVNTTRVFVPADRFYAPEGSVARLVGIVCRLESDIGHSTSLSYGDPNSAVPVTVPKGVHSFHTVSFCFNQRAALRIYIDEQEAELVLVATAQAAERQIPF
jgi:hypothetical protein